jgi:ClpX C4-type zinc finger
MSEETFTTRVPGRDGQDRCAFCGKAAGQVDRLIYARPPEGGLRVAICNECVVLYHSWLSPTRA